MINVNSLRQATHRDSELLRSFSFSGAHDVAGLQASGHSGRLLDRRASKIQEIPSSHARLPHLCGCWLLFVLTIPPCAEFPLESGGDSRARQSDPCECRSLQEAAAEQRQLGALDLTLTHPNGVVFSMGAAAGAAESFSTTERRGRVSAPP